MYRTLEKETEIKIQRIVEGGYVSSAFGTVDKDSYPLVTKVIPMSIGTKIYLLLSDLSEHTKNISINDRAALYFCCKEQSKQKGNNPRLSITGRVEKLDLKKTDGEFLELLNAYAKVEGGSKMWGMFQDFNFYSFLPKRLLFVEGFGKAFQKYF
jgi:putative heme iron utilization protein